MLTKISLIGWNVTITSLNLTLTPRFRKKAAQLLIHLFAFALWASGFEFFMFGDGEHLDKLFAALTAEVFVSRHGNSSFDFLVSVLINLQTTGLRFGCCFGYDLCN
jgi:hypothetical protein